MTGKNCSQSVNFCCKKNLFLKQVLYESLTALEAEICNHALRVKDPVVVQCFFYINMIKRNIFSRSEATL